MIADWVKEGGAIATLSIEEVLRLRREMKNRQGEGKRREEKSKRKPRKS